MDLVIQDLLLSALTLEIHIMNLVRFLSNMGLIVRNLLRFALLGPQHCCEPRQNSEDFADGASLLISREVRRAAWFSSKTAYEFR